MTQDIRSTQDSTYRSITFNKSLLVLLIPFFYTTFESSVGAFTQLVLTTHPLVSSCLQQSKEVKEGVKHNPPEVNSMRVTIYSG